MDQIQEADRQLVYQMQARFEQLKQWRDTLDYERFIEDQERLRVVAGDLAKIGQAARAISPSFKAHFNSIAWDSLVDLESAISDEDGASADITWGMLKDDLPYLANTIDQVVEFLENNGSDPTEA